MNYKIKVYKTKNNEWNTKAYVSVTFNDCFIVTGITVREGNNNSLFVAIPSQLVSRENGTKEYEDVCFPITKEFRSELYDAILKEKDVVKQKQQEEFNKIDEMDKENLPFR